MRYRESEDPYVFGRFASGDTVTLVLYAIPAGTVVPITSGSCTPLASPNADVFVWSSLNIITPPTSYTEYYWVMDNGADVQRSGKLALHGFPDELPASVDAELTSTHGVGSWQQTTVVGAALNEVPNASSTLTTGSTVTGDYSETAELDGTYWQILDAAGALDMYFEFLIDADGVPNSVSHQGRLSGLGDDLDVFAWNWVGAAWEQVGTLLGKNAPGDELTTWSLFSQHVGAGANLGKVRVRFYAAAGLTTANFYSDQVVLSYAITGRSVGYADGAIWVDTLNGTAGATPFINGVADKPVDSWADALTLSSLLGIKRFHVAGGSSIALTANSDYYQILGAEYSLALAGQSIASAMIVGATVSGISAGSGARFIDCRIGTVSLTECGMGRCAITSAITLLSAGTYMLEGCFSAVAGTSTPTIDFGAAVGNTNVNFRHWSGGIEVLNMGVTGTDNMSLEGDGQVVLNANCAGGTLAIRGNFTITDNAGGAVTISDDARYDVQQVRDSMKLAPSAGAPSAGAVDEHLDDILADTAAIDARLPSDPADESLQQAAHAQTQSDIAAVQADTDDIQTRLPAALVGGRMDSDVAVIQPNAVNASALATDAVNEIVDQTWDEAATTHLTAGTAGWHQALSAYEGAVWLDEKNGSAGTTPGQHGTKASPVDTLSDAVTLLASALLSGLRQLNIRQTTGGPLDLSVAGDWDQFLFMGVGDSGDISIDPTGVDIDGSEFHNVTLTGDAGGYNFHAHHCLVEDLANIGNATFGHTRLRGVISINGGATPHFHGCFSQELLASPPPEIRFTGAVASYAHVQDYHGELLVGGLSVAGDKLELQTTGLIVFLNTCTGGDIELQGVGKQVDNSAGTTIDDDGWVEGAVLRSEHAAIFADTDAIDARLPSDPADESLQQAAHTQTQADIAAMQSDVTNIEYQGAIWMDEGAGAAGTVVGVNGLPTNPSDNIADALALLASTGLRVLRTTGGAVGAITPVGSLAGLRFDALASPNYLILSSTTSVQGASFHRMTLTGVSTAGALVAMDCTLIGVTVGAAVLRATRCLFSGTTVVGFGGDSVLIDCGTVAEIATPHVLDANSVAGARLVALRYAGNLQINNLVGTLGVSHINMAGGELTLDSTCTAGTIVVSGDCVLTDNSGGGCTVIDNRNEPVVAATIADAVWDEAALDHVAAGSTGLALSEALGLTGRHKVVAVLTKVLTGNGTGLPLTQRVRVYNSAANATLDDGVTGLISEHAVTATYTGNSMDTFESLGP